MQQADQEYIPKFQKEADNSQKRFKKWTKSENEEYAKYLLAHLDEIQENEHRVSHCFFNKMSKELQINRDNLQCRSHHQKMLKKH